MTNPINIRNISVKCGHCNTYQTLLGFARNGDWNVYTYECENDTCDPTVTRTLIEVPAELDAFARRDPEWRGGGKHGEVGDGAPTD
jgi:hypothetical protein